MHDMKTRSLDDLGRILDDGTATAATQILAAALARAGAGPEGDERPPAVKYR